MEWFMENRRQTRAKTSVAAVSSHRLTANAHLHRNRFTDQCLGNCIFKFLFYAFVLNNYVHPNLGIPSTRDNYIREI